MFAVVVISSSPEMLFTSIPSSVSPTLILAYCALRY